MEKHENFLVPSHKKLTEVEVKTLLDKYSLSDKTKLPKVKLKDPALAKLGVVVGDVVEITRKSFAGENKYYRCVVE